MWPNFRKRTFSRKIMTIKHLHSIARHSTILYRKSMKFVIQEGVLLSLLDTKFYLFPVQNGGMTSDWMQAFDHNNFAGKGLFSIIRSHIISSVCIWKLKHCINMWGHMGAEMLLLLLIVCLPLQRWNNKKQILKLLSHLGNYCKRYVERSVFAMLRIFYG